MKIKRISIEVNKQIYQGIYQEIPTLTSLTSYNVTLFPSSPAPLCTYDTHTHSPLTPLPPPPPLSGALDTLAYLAP